VVVDIKKAPKERILPGPASRRGARTTSYSPSLKHGKNKKTLRKRRRVFWRNYGELEGKLSEKRSKI